MKVITVCNMFGFERPKLKTTQKKGGLMPSSMRGCLTCLEDGAAFYGTLYLTFIILRFLYRLLS